MAGAVEQIRWLIFSDTILLTLPLYSVDSDSIKVVKWYLFFLQSALLCRYMLDIGLPIRGAITAGDFLVVENCFAGKPIVEAYKTSQNLDLAACVIDKDAYEQLKILLKDADKIVTKAFEDILAYCLIPRKRMEGKKEKTRALNMLSFTGDEFTDSKTISNDVRQYVLNAFSQHNKDVSADVQSKVANTEQFLRFLML